MVEKLQPHLVWSSQLTDIGDHERTKSLAERVRTTVLPLTFQPFHIGGYKGQDTNFLMRSVTLQ